MLTLRPLYGRTGKKGGAMKDSNNVIGAFSEDHAAELSGVSRAQLRRWDRIGFLSPSYGQPDRGQPFSRLYSFRDLVALRVLNDLRNEKGVPLQHLRKVAEHLAHLGDAKWTCTTLYVLGKRVVFEDPATKSKTEIVSGQRVLDIPLRVVISDTRRAIQRMNERGSDERGQIVRSRFVMQNEPVFAGTRIPVATIKRYLDAGYPPNRIIEEFPQLTATDIKAASNYDGRVAA